MRTVTNYFVQKVLKIQFCSGSNIQIIKHSFIFFEIKHVIDQRV